MVKTTKQKTPQGEARAEAQRERILVAAQRCFIEVGLNSTSISHIAEAADMSPGLLYRYFASKTEITRAVISRQLRLTLASMEAKSEPADIATEWVDAYSRPHDPERDELHPVLLLETVAEASRDPVIAAALREFEDATRELSHKILRRSKDKGGRGLPEELIKQRGLIIELLYQGVKMRQVHDPELDTELLLSALQEAIRNTLKV